MNNITQTIKTLSLAAILSFGISFAYAWTAPTVAPTGGNTAAPLTTSSSNQTKTGGITFGGNIGANAMAISNTSNGALSVLGGANLATSGGNVGIGTASPGAKLDVVGDVRAQNAWLRTTGNTGWYSDSYGGGWHMSDPTWIRSYGSKNVYSDSAIRADGGFQVDGNQVIDADAGWHRTYGNSGWYNGTYCGGWYMQDSTWIRSYCSKPVYMDNNLAVAGNVGIGTTAPGAKLEVAGNIIASAPTASNHVATKGYVDALTFISYITTTREQSICSPLACSGSFPAAFCPSGWTVNTSWNYSTIIEQPCSFGSSRSVCTTQTLCSK